MDQTQTQQNAAFQAAGLTGTQRGAVVTGQQAPISGGFPTAKAAPNVSQTIDASAINPVNSAPVTLPPAPQNTTDTNALNSIPTIESITSSLGTQTPSEKTNQDLSSKALDLTGQLGGKSAAQTAANNAAGLPALNAQLTDLNSQITGLQNEANAIPQQLQIDAAGRGITAGGLAPHQADKIRQNTIKALGISTLASTLRGNIATAQAQADAAVKAQFDPIQQQLDYINKAIELNLPQMNKQEQQQAAIVQAQLAERQRLLDQQKEDKSTIYAWAATAVKNNPNSQAAQMAAQQALATGDLQQAFALVGQYQDDPNATQEALDKHLIAQANVAQSNASIRASDASVRASNANTDKIKAETKALSNPIVINNPAYAGVVDTILASDKFSKEQTAQIKTSINNGEDPFSVVKNQAKNIMGQTQANTVTNYEKAQYAMSSIQKNLAEYYKNGGKTNVFSGNLEKTINKLGAEKDPKLVELATQIQSGLQIYRNAVSGTAYSVQEGTDIASIFPGINKTEGLNNSIIKGRMAAFDDSIDGAYAATLGESTYAKLKALNQGKTSATVSSAPQVIPASQIPAGYYQASDGLLYKK